VKVKREASVPFAFGTAVACAMAVTVAIPAVAQNAPTPAPAAAEPAGQPSANGRYFVVLRPAKLPVPINEWTDFAIEVRRRDGAPLELTELALDGGMPAHGHGLPTAPNVLRTERAGEFRATGVRFNMGGRWELRVLLIDGQGSDVATFAFDLGDRGGASPPANSAPPARPAAPLVASWSDEQRATLRSLWLRNLGAPRADPTNRVADDPRAVALGHRLFFDPGLSGNRDLACATCHQPKRHFTDGRATGRGVATLDRNTPSLVGVGYARWLFWDGRRDSTWSQALDPIETPTEMNGNRLEVLRHIKRTAAYHADYRALFGPLPDLDGLPKRAGPVGDESEQAAWRALPAARQQALARAFVNVGKIIAAYERRLLPGPAPFDAYVEALEAGDSERAARTLPPAAVGGLRLFISNDTQCLKCHNGPLFTNGGFHNIGTGVIDGPHPDFGRMIGVQALMATDLTCLGPYSDDPTRECPNLRFLNRHEDGSFAGAYRVPSLRNVEHTAPYMHDGRFSSLDAVIRHYQTPASAGAPIEFRPMADLTPDHIQALAAFLRSLSAPIQAPAALLKPPVPVSRTRASPQARMSVMAPVK
jgi:cytochrome c peroxidase